MSFSSPLDARQFLVNKIIAQASRVGVNLSDVDQRMLLLNPGEPQSARGIPLAVLEDTGRSYENRIVQLLKSAYDRDRGEERRKYREAFEGLKGSNHYILIIASAALRRENQISNLAVYIIIVLAVAGIALLLAWWAQSR